MEPLWTLLPLQPSNTLQRLKGGTSSRDAVRSTGFTAILLQAPLTKMYKK